jgi:hypothetical protein
MHARFMNPLPIVHSALFGDCLFIDNSTLEFLDTCPRSMEYFYMNKRTSSDERGALNFGGGVHAALACRYSQASGYQDFCSGTPVEQQMIERMDEYFAANPLPIDGWRTAEHARNIVLGYNTRYDVEPFRVLEQAGKPLTEFPFAFKLVTTKAEVPKWEYEAPGWDKKITHRLITWFYTGRIDLVVGEGSQIFTLDHKTTSMMGDGFWMEQRVSPQHEGYCWAWWKATGLVPAGYIVNGIRTRKPLVRDESGKSKRSQRQDVEADDFQRDKVFIDLPRLMEWESNLKAKLETFLWYYSRGYFPAHKKWCVGKYGACQYYDVCSLSPEFRIPTLNSGNFKDATWSPLERKEGEVVPKPDNEYPIDWENLMKESVE